MSQADQLTYELELLPAEAAGIDGQVRHYCTDLAARLSTRRGRLLVETAHPHPQVIEMRPGPKPLAVVMDLTTGRAEAVDEPQGILALFQLLGDATGDFSLAGLLVERHIDNDDILAVRKLAQVHPGRMTIEELTNQVGGSRSSMERRLRKLRRVGLTCAPTMGRNGGVKLTPAGYRAALTHTSPAG